MASIPLILASGDEYGPIVFIVIAIVVWLFKTVSAAMKAVNKQAARKPKPVVAAAVVKKAPAATRPFAPGAFSGVIRRGNDHTKKVVRPVAKKVQAAAPPVPAPPLAPPKPFVRQVTAKPPLAAGGIAKLDVTTALRRRLVWSEILSKPLALREESH